MTVDYHKYRWLPFACSLPFFSAHQARECVLTWVDAGPGTGRTHPVALRMYGDFPDAHCTQQPFGVRVRWRPADCQDPRFCLRPSRSPHQPQSSICRPVSRCCRWRCLPRLTPASASSAACSSNNLPVHVVHHASNMSGLSASAAPKRRLARRRACAARYVHARHQFIFVERTRRNATCEWQR